MKCQRQWDGMSDFRLHGMNRAFVKFLLCRITGFIEQQSGGSTNFSTYFLSLGKKPFEVEHIWADKFAEHRDEFDQQHEFDSFRQRIGDLLLLPQGTNQSYGSMPYADKLGHYLKENLLVKSLHPKTYENNPNFVDNAAEGLGLKFKAHTYLSRRSDIDERQELIQGICEVIWDSKVSPAIMNEAETRAEHIDPALKAAGWGVVEGSRIRREYPITPGRIEGQGRRGKPLTADYVLEYRNTKLAVIEAKAWDQALTEGVAQAKNYAGKMAIRYTYSSNGQGIYGIDMQTGKEGETPSYPTPDELWNMTFAKANAWRDRFAAVPYPDKSGTWTHPLLPGDCSQSRAGGDRRRHATACS